MSRSRRTFLDGALVCVTTFLLFTAAALAQTDPLPSWNDGPVKQAIVNFVKMTTDKSSPRFVSQEERIATFDQDGTTWVQHPMYTQEDAHLLISSSTTFGYISLFPK